MNHFKGYIGGALGALISSPLLPEHPLLYGLATALIAVVIVLFWTGAIGIRRS
jgi:hypothetical protein